MHERRGISWLAMRLSASQHGIWCVKWNLLVRSALLGRNNLATIRRLFLPPSSRHTGKGDLLKWHRCSRGCEVFNIPWLGYGSIDEKDRSSRMQPAPSSFYNTSSTEWTAARTQLHLCAFHVEWDCLREASRFAFSFRSVFELFRWSPTNLGHSELRGPNFSQVIAYSG
jgi:hypothetical protein